MKMRLFFQVAQVVAVILAGNSVYSEKSTVYGQALASNAALQYWRAIVLIPQLTDGEDDALDEFVLSKSTEEVGQGSQAV